MSAQHELYFYSVDLNYVLQALESVSLIILIEMASLVSFNRPAHGCDSWRGVIAIAVCNKLSGKITMAMTITEMMRSDGQRWRQPKGDPNDHQVGTANVHEQRSSILRSSGVAVCLFIPLLCLESQISVFGSSAQADSLWGLILIML